MHTGLKAVSTAAPTAPGMPYIIKHNVRDSAGNAAATRIRRVFVLCPTDQALCSSDDSQVTWYCSLTADSCVPLSDAAPDPVKRSVSIKLLGPSSVSVPVGSVYAACGDHVPTSAACDRGAEAIDSGARKPG